MTPARKDDTADTAQHVQRQAEADALEAARAALEAGRAREGRTAFLARASMALGATLDSVATLQQVARLAVPELADICIIDLTHGVQQTRRAAFVHAELTPHELSSLLEEQPIPANSPQDRALSTTQAQIGTIEPGESAPWPASSAEGRAIVDLAVRSYLVLPLRSRGETLGVVTLLSSQRRSYSADEFATAGEFVRRTAVALDNALLYESAVHARAAAEAAREQTVTLVAGLRESEDKYRSLFEESRDAVYSTRRDGGFIDVNPAALELFGYSRDELLQLNARDLYADPSQRDAFRADIDVHGSVREFELVLRCKSGALIDCLLTSMVRRDPSGEIVGYQGIIHDITERKRSELRLMESEHFTRTIISSVQQGVIVFDRDLNCQVWNRVMEEMTGVRADQVVGTRNGEALALLGEHAHERMIERALAGETVQTADQPFDAPLTGQSGWISCVYSPHVARDGSVMGVVVIIHDVTDRKQAEDQLVHNAFHDALTGLPNRALFIDRLERMLRHSERHDDYVFGVAFLDLDRFKVIYDSLGQIASDQLLVALGRRLEACLRTGDTVARLGGDEFAVLLDDLRDVRDATRVAERIFKELSVPFHIAGQDVFASASIGIALSSTGYDKTEDILRDADTAMYRAKIGGSRYELFDKNMHETAVETLQVETDLRRALERQELRVHYQPIIALADGRITGFEALVRWQHPKRGMVMPGDFIPLAEETGLICPIGWWVLEESCVQMQKWLALFPDRSEMTMSVNLSSKQFVQTDLLERVDSILERTGLPPTALKLEITESAVVQHEEAVTFMLAALRSRGIQLCIDDFGTGYSALSYLHSFPVDTLKIDRSFVSKLCLTTSTQQLVETIVALSNNLGMNAVAEGVETQEQLDFLRAIGPQYVQGFLFSCACSAEDIEEMLLLDPVW